MFRDFLRQRGLELSEEIITQQRRHFTLYFILALLAASAVIFFVFRDAQISSLERRQQTSKTYMHLMDVALKAYAKDHDGQFPATLAELIPKYQPDAYIFTHPAWPDRPGYIYIPGVRASDLPATIVLFENTPPDKPKLNRLIKRLDGETEALTPNDFHSRIAAQSATWQSDKRVWALQISPQKGNLAQ